MSFPAYPEYQDSGVPWLGKVPAHWEVMQSRRMFCVRSEPALADDQMLTASQKYGVLAQSDFIEREGRRVVEVILGKENLKHVEPNDFIISMRSFQGGLEWCRLRGSTSFHYVMVTPVKHVHPPFFARLFKSSTYIQALRATTDLIRDGQELRYSNFVQVPLPVVPLTEQAAIAAFLDRETDKIDALVAEQVRLIALLKEKRQAVISHAVTKGLNPDAPMKDSGIAWLGEIPERWSTLPLKAVSRGEGTVFIDGDWIESKDISESGVRYITTGNVGEGVYKEQGSGFISDDTFAALDCTEVLPGDVLISRLNLPIGRACIVPDLGTRIVTSVDNVIVRAGDHVDRRYLIFLLSSKSFFSHTETLARGTTMQRISRTVLGNIRICLPPVEEQMEIAATIQTDTAKIDTLVGEAQAAITLLQERRAALISAAVTGKIDVRSAATGSNVVPIKSTAPAAVVPALRAVVGAIAVQELGPMGRMAVMKAGFLAEAHVGFSDLNGRYERFAAGPYDRTLLEAMEHGALELCGIVTHEPRSAGEVVTYDIPSTATAAPGEALRALVGEDAAARFRRMLSLLKGIGRQGVEAVATIYAVWNDLLADGQDADQEMICRGVLTDWHDEKAKKFNQGDLEHWLAWMRRHGFEPDGTAPRTDNQGKLFR